MLNKRHFTPHGNAQAPSTGSPVILAKGGFYRADTIVSYTILRGRVEDAEALRRSDYQEYDGGPGRSVARCYVRRFAHKTLCVMTVTLDI